MFGHFSRDWERSFWAFTLSPHLWGSAFIGMNVLDETRMMLLFVSLVALGSLVYVLGVPGREAKK
ncbi:MAG: hypothetical protein U0903_06555 [Planctomycetales bacterium]